MSRPLCAEVSSWSGSHLSLFPAQLEQAGLVHGSELLSDRRSVDLLVPGATCQLPLQPSTARPAAGSGRTLENEGMK